MTPMSRPSEPTGRRARRRAAVALCLLLGACPAALRADVSARDLPVLGDASSSLISPEMERQIGGQFLKRSR